MSRRCLAIFPWSNEIEDYLGPLGLGIEDFCEHMDGGWLFNTIRALQREGWSSVIYLISSGTSVRSETVHEATGARVVVLPSTALYRRLRSLCIDPYGRTAGDMFGPRPLPLRPLFQAMFQVFEHLGTPVRDVFRDMRRGVFSHVLVQEYEYGRYDVIAALGRITGVPVFATFQGAAPSATALGTAFRRLSLRSASRLFIGSRAEVERVEAAYAIPAPLIATVPNPIEVEAYPLADREQARKALGLPQSASIAVCHCRIAVEAKGLDVLVEAWQVVVASGLVTEPLLLLVGDGPDSDSLQQLLEKVPARTVRWHRDFVLDRSAICRFLCAADTYVIASRREGFAVAPLEAMACGLPVIVTDAPGLADLVDSDAEDAFGAVVPRNDPQALAAVLSQWLSRPETLRTRGAAARRAVERYSLEHVGRVLSRAMLDAGGQ